MIRAARNGMGLPPRSATPRESARGGQWQGSWLQLSGTATGHNAAAELALLACTPRKERAVAPDGGRVLRAASYRRRSDVMGTVAST